MRPLYFLLLIVFFSGAGLGAVLCHEKAATAKWHTSIKARKQLASTLELGQPVLSTEAPHLRHFGHQDYSTGAHTVISGFDLFPGSAVLLPCKNLISRDKTQ